MLVNYSSESEDNDIQLSKSTTAKSNIFPKSKKINLNPQVDISQLQQKKIDTINKSLMMITGGLGEQPRQNHLTGMVSSFHTHDYNFHQQFHNFQNFGIGYDPSVSVNKRLVVNKQKYPQLFNQIRQGNDLPQELGLSINLTGTLSNEQKERTQNLKRQREQNGDITENTDSYRGPWAGYDGELKAEQTQLTQVQREKIKENEQKQKEIEENQEKEREDFKATCEFHFENTHDYQGRSYLEASVDVKGKSHDHKCYIPKKNMHIYTGHTKGVHTVRFFPKYGQYVLSGSLDSTIKLWDVNNGFDRKCVVTFKGHTSAVRDLEFTKDGSHFLSCGYDKIIIYWDTETGKAVQTFRLKSFPYCARFHPDPDKQNSFLLGSSNQKIAQFDIRSGSRTQVYDEHLGAVNTVTFIDNYKQFVSTSDDKKIFLWEFGIPVVVKHVSEPEMHAVSYAAMHPSMQFWCGQSSDNQLAVYDTKAGNFRVNRKKKFTGHQCSGYSINLGFSPDGQFVCSGDSEGRAYFWDWKSGGNYRIIQAHDGVCMGIDWHPLDPSQVVTCGYDGYVQLWD